MKKKYFHEFVYLSRKQLLVFKLQLLHTAETGRGASVGVQEAFP